LASIIMPYKIDITASNNNLTARILRATKE